MQKSVYLDYNIFAYIFEGAHVDLHRKIEQLRLDYKVPYSPAHIEEVATALMQPKPDASSFLDALKLSHRRLQSISEITSNVELLPNDSGPTLERIESPWECFIRVIKHYDVNQVIESREEIMLAAFKATDANGELANRNSNLPNDFLSDPKHESDIKLKLYFDVPLALAARKVGVSEIKWPEISRSHALTERTLELVMNHLEEIRYRPEKVSKSRSRMHDVTHAIYAASTDYLVSNDPRFLEKARVAYQYLGIKTKVLSLERFMELETLSCEA